MPIERMFVRVMLFLSLLFIVLSGVFYSPTHVVLPIGFFVIFFIGDQMLAGKSSDKNESKWRKWMSKVLIWLLGIACFACLSAIAYMWRMGHFGRFIS